MRIELKGDGDPNPIFALPEPGSDSTLPPLTLNLPDGEPFIPGPYIEQGYNRYEVWCLGGAGGQGGGAYDDVGFQYDPIHYEYFAPAVSDLNPTGMVPVTNYRDPYMTTPRLWGGGGGGGGLHVVSGFLVVLPDEVEVVVGQAGVDAVRGQMETNGAYTPYPNDYYISTILNPGVYPTLEFSARYALPHPSFNPPVTGEDGGTSSFNGDMCQASGGKGGGPAMTWSGSTRMADGHGGEGGCGDSSTAGGGAPGSATSSTGTDGTWDGTIGKGGGGGRGGVMSPNPPSKPWAV
jgi:hypothetical protein